MTATSFDVPPADGKTIHQGIDQHVGLGMGGIGQVGIAGGSQDAVKPKDFLNFQQVTNSRRFRRHRLRSSGWHNCGADCAG